MLKCSVHCYYDFIGIMHIYMLINPRTVIISDGAVY